MNLKTVLVVEEHAETLEVVQHTLIDSNMAFGICNEMADAWHQFLTRPEITHVLIRMRSDRINGCELCRRIREVKPAKLLPIIMIVDEDQLEHASKAIEAGATDVLIDPFESRELRMKLNITSSVHQRRVDGAHPASVSETREAGEQQESETLVSEETPPDRLEPNSRFVVPRFDPISMRFCCGVSEAQLAVWQNDERVTKVALDEVLVCPCCRSVPTFRQGCGSCGSAWVRPEMLIHHYACAHIGPESEFRQGSSLVCPKCRRKDLVAGSDFETVRGGMVCSDCDAKCSQPELIGHCLSCQHRFPAHEAITVQLTGFHVPRDQAETDPARQISSRQHRQRRSATVSALPEVSQAQNDFSD